MDVFLNKKSISSHLTNLDIQEEINRIEECLNLPKTVKLFIVFLILSKSNDFDNFSCLLSIASIRIHP